MAKKEYTLQINGVSENITKLTSLLDVLKQVESEIGKGVKTSAASAKASKERKAAMSEEEKAAKKLEDTQKRTKAVQEGLNDAQIKANQALREATREQMLRIKAERASTNSIEEMRAKLSAMKDEWKGIDVGTEEFQKMSEEIRVLNDRIKEAEYSTGDFRRNVGNYESALGGLEKLSEGFNTASKTSMGFAQSLLATNQLMFLFGSETEDTREQARQLQKIIALLSIATQINNNLIKENIKQNTFAAAVDKIRAIQIKAKTAAEAASTKGTVAATVAQRVFNAVAAANPYVLLALAIAGVVTGLALFISSSGKAKSAEDKHKQSTDDLTRSIEKNNKELDRRNSILRAMGATELTIIKSTIDSIRKNENAARAALDNYMGDVKKKGVKYDAELHKSLQSTWQEQRDALQDAATEHDNYYRTIETRLKNHGKTEAQLRTEQYEEDLKAVTHSSDLKKILEKEYQLDMQEIRKRGATQARDTANGEREKLIKDLEDYGKAEIQLLTEKYDREFDLLEGNSQARNRLTLKYNDDRKALEEKAAREREAIEKKSLDALKSAQAERLKVINLTLGEAELSLTQSLNRIGEIVARDSDGLQLIDVKATRKNLADTNAALDQYISGVRKYQGELTAAHMMTLKTLREGTPEYIEETQRYASAMEDATSRINDALKEQKANMQMSSTAWAAYFDDLFTKVGNIASDAADAISAITDTLNMGLQIQIENMNEQLTVISERYEEARRFREQTVKDVEDLEARLQDATGGTAVALKEQLQDAMHARAEAEREERRLAREKEKMEADIAKKEKQARRNELTAQIAQSIANTALAVTKSLPNLVLAAIVGGMGLVQTGIMVKQLTKLADGGEIVGRSHAQGGIPIHGTNYEVEGGEFVVNKRSYGANAGLINFINDTPRAVTAADLLTVVPADISPVGVDDIGQTGDDRVVDAINNIDFHPVVSVKDINDVDEEMVTVEDLAGF